MAHVHHSNGLCALDASPNALDASYDPVGALQIHADPFRAAPRSSGRFDSGWRHLANGRQAVGDVFELNAHGWREVSRPLEVLRRDITSVN